MRLAGFSTGLLPLCVAAIAGCADPAPDEAPMDAAPVDGQAARDVSLGVEGTSGHDATTDAPRDAGPDAPTDVAPSGMAPGDAVPGAMALTGGSVTVAVSSSMGRVYRIDARADEHLGFRLDFAPAGATTTSTSG